MNEKFLRFIAEAPAIDIDKQEQNDVYMTVKLRMLSTQPNKNKHVVEASFINEIIGNQFYVGTPIRADTSRLSKGIKFGLGHRFNSETKEYMTEQIGSILSFESAYEDGYLVLYGIARIDKARASVYQTIIEMYEEGILFFSFEIVAKQYRREGDFIYIGADEKNHLTGMCIVSVPAYEQAKAIRLVAELDENTLKNIDSLTSWQAELEVDEVRAKLYRMLFEEETSPLKGWRWEIREFGVDYLMVKEFGTGMRMMVQFHVIDEEVIIDEIYEVEIVRKVTEQAPQMIASDEIDAKKDCDDRSDKDMEEKNGEVQAEVVVEKEPETIEAEVKEPETVVTEPETIEAEVKEPTANETDARIEALMAEVNELKEFKRKAEEAKLNAELETKKTKLRNLIIKHGAKVEDFSAEIEKLDYESIVASLDSVQIEAEVTDKPLNPFVGNGVVLGNSKWAGYISDTTGLRK